MVFKSDTNNIITYANTKTVYRISSITKMYTAAITFQLIQNVKLSMDTWLSDYFPTIPNASKIYHVVLEFVLNNDSTLKEMILKQGGGEITFKK